MDLPRECYRSTEASVSVLPAWEVTFRRDRTMEYETRVAPGRLTRAAAKEFAGRRLPEGLWIFAGAEKRG